MPTGSGRSFKETGGSFAGLRFRAGVPVSVAGRSEKAGDGCVPHDPSEKESVFAGADRYRQDALYRISGGKGSRGRAGGADFYATAKTITRTVAEEAFSVLRGNGFV